jgi:Protein of unknown function (DUF3631)
VSELSEVWEAAVDSLAAILEDVERFIRRFVALTDAQVAAIALWVILSYAVEAFEVVPYLNIHSALKRSGKTLLLEVLAVLVRRPMLVADLSAAVLFRAVDERKPTLLFDEVDVIFGGKSERADELRGLLNAGYKRGGVAMRVEMRGKEGVLRDFNVFGLKALAGIGQLPDTVDDRSIPLEMLRQARGSRVERFRTRGKLEETAPLRERMARWTAANLDELAQSWPTLPEELNDRQQDIWEPMFSLADLAGPEWGLRARAAARALHGDDDEADTQVAVLLLGHLRDLFGERQKPPALATETILEALVDNDAGPWARWWSVDSDHGRRSAASGLARVLKPFGIRSTKIKVDGVALRGYRRDSFAESWTRYLPGEMEPTPTSGTPQVGPTSMVPLVAVGSVSEETDPIRTGPDDETCVRCTRYGHEHTSGHIRSWASVGSSA